MRAPSASAAACRASAVCRICGRPSSPRAPGRPRRPRSRGSAPGALPRGAASLRAAARGATSGSASSAARFSSRRRLASRSQLRRPCAVTSSGGSSSPRRSPKPRARRAQVGRSSHVPLGASATAFRGSIHALRRRPPSAGDGRARQRRGRHRRAGRRSRVVGWEEIAAAATSQVADDLDQKARHLRGLTGRRGRASPS
jgi:hypothetical protein